MLQSKQYVGYVAQGAGLTLQESGVENLFSMLIFMYIF